MADANEDLRLVPGYTPLMMMTEIIMEKAALEIREDHEALLARGELPEYADIDLVYPSYPYQADGVPLATPVNRPLSSNPLYEPQPMTHKWAWVTAAAVGTYALIRMSRRR